MCGDPKGGGDSGVSGEEADTPRGLTRGREDIGNPTVKTPFCLPLPLPRLSVGPRLALRSLPRTFPQTAPLCSSRPNSPTASLLQRLPPPGRATGQWKRLRGLGAHAPLVETRGPGPRR